MTTLKPTLTILAMTALVVVAAFRVQAQEPGAQAQVQAAQTVASGLYTAEQAKRGEGDYLYLCVECHGATLTGGIAPSLAGPEFHARYKGLTFRVLFEKVRAPMPPYEPPQPNRQESIDILAYIMKANGLPAGPNELKPDIVFLDKFLVEPLKR